MIIYGIVNEIFDEQKTIVHSPPKINLHNRQEHND
jgi:hypothetical protein